MWTRWSKNTKANSMKAKNVKLQLKENYLKAHFLNLLAFIAKDMNNYIAGAIWNPSFKWLTLLCAKELVQKLRMGIKSECHANVWAWLDLTYLFQFLYYAELCHALYHCAYLYYLLFKWTKLLYSIPKWRWFCWCEKDLLS